MDVNSNRAQPAGDSWTAGKGERGEEGRGSSLIKANVPVQPGMAAAAASAAAAAVVGACL